VRFLLVLWLLHPCADAVSQQTPQRANPSIEKQEVPSKKPENSAKPPKDTVPQPQTPARTTLPPVARPVDASHEEEDDVQPENRWMYRFTTDPVATFTGLLFAATVLLWWATRGLVKGAEQTAERQLRAYVVAEAASIRDADSSQSFGVTVVIHNFGQTPAYKYATSLNVQLVEASTNSITELLTNPKSQQTQASIGPGAIILANSTLRAFAPAERAALASGTTTLFVFGEIRYTDAFGAARYTRFRYLYGHPYALGEDGALPMAETGNEAD
jgi:hypothetical protein